MENEADRTRLFTRRAMLLGVGQLGVVGALVTRLGWLTLFQNSKYKLQAQENSISLRLIAPRRGLILDRFGTALALNKPDYRLALIPEQIKDLDATLAVVSQFIPLTEDDILRIRRDIGRVPKYLPVEIAHNVDWTAFSALNVHLPDLVGVQPVQGFTRVYPDGAKVAHLVGYVGAPSEQQVDASDDALMHMPGFHVGKEGLELVADQRLRGVAGAARVEVNARGRVIRELDKVPDQQGDSLVLTIDHALQTFTAERLEGEAASAILLSVDTGEILAFASQPGYDPNLFAEGISKEMWTSLTLDDHHPLFNKPIRGQFPPGSTFKPVTAMAAMAAGVDPTHHYGCSGQYRLGSALFHCWRRHGHGSVDLHKGLVQSCDCYFYQAGRAAGVDAIAAMARKFGLGESFDLPIPWQKSGLVPDSQWKLKRYKRQWLEGETLNYAIGQGYLLATPLQLAVMAARLASGRAVVPRLYRDATEPTPAPLLDVSAEHLALVRKGLTDVVNGGGTAARSRFNIRGMTMAGKTGSAQVRRISLAERRHGVRKNESLPWEQREHALFIAFAPADAPRYALATVIEHGAHGAAAALVARDILELALTSDPLAKRALLMPKSPPRRNNLPALKDLVAATVEEG